MSKKLFIGLAAVGGGLYYYDQNVLPIFSKDAKGRPVGIKAKPSEDVRKEFSKLDDKALEFGLQLKKTYKESASEIRQKTNETVDSIKELDLYNKWSAKLDDYLKDVQRAAEEVDNKPLPNRLAAKYIDFVNDLGKTEDEKLRELQSATSSRQQEIKDDLARSKQLWSSWWSGKKDEAADKTDELANRAEREKDLWLGWGRAKKNEAELKVNEGKRELEKEKNSWSSWALKKGDETERAARDAKADAKAEKDKWVNWGSSKADEAERRAKGTQADLRSNIDQQKKEFNENYEIGKRRAVDEYNRAKKQLDDLTQQAKDKANRVLGKAQDPVTDDHLHKAKLDFQSALTNLRKYGSDLVDSAKGH